jgi:hypothetical protein
MYYSVWKYIVVFWPFTGCIKITGAVWKLIIFTSMVKRLIDTGRNERVTLQVYDTCLQMFLFFGVRRKDCLTRSMFSSDTRGRPALFPLQRHSAVWNCWYQRLMLLWDGGWGGMTVELSPECPLNRNNWFVFHKLQHTERLLLRSRHYRFVTSQTEREEGSGIAHAHKTWTPAVSFHVGKLTSAYVLIAVMADWNRSRYFDTPCI